ncbi:hypothetical protein ABIB87_005414 [Bradyrhizobium sp. JR18.2]
MRCFAFYGTGNPCAPVSPSALLRSVFTRTAEGATMPRVKQASKQKRTAKITTVKALGAAGLGLSLAGSASASTMPAADIPQSNTSPNQRFFLGEEEMADVSLATFHLFDRENFGSGVQLARGCGGCGCGHGGGGCGGGRGCGGGGFVGGRGCGGGGFVGGRGCGGGGFVGVRGCGGGGFVGVRGCGGGGFVGVRGCGGFRGCRGFRGCGCGGCGFSIGFYDDIGFDDWGYGGWGFGGCAGCCGSWGACRLC